MSRVVLDASAVLALVNGESGADVLLQKPELLENAVVSTVNVAEVHSKLVSRGMPPEDAWLAATVAANQIVDFDQAQAKIAGTLLLKTKSLSLSDRACLALGITLKAPVFTADRAWKNLKLGIPIHVIR